MDELHSAVEAKPESEEQPATLVGHTELRRGSPVVHRSLSPRFKKKAAASSSEDFSALSVPPLTAGHSRSSSLSPALHVQLRKKNMKKPNGNMRPKSIAVIHDVSKRPGDALELGMPLIEAIYDKRMKVGFRKFLESEFSVENLDFWLAVEEFKKIKDRKFRKTRAQEIYAEYVSPGSPRQINLDFYTRQQALKQMAGDLSQSSSIFNTAQRYVFNIMENDSYARFLRSKYYDICAQQGRRSPRRFFQDILHNTTRSRNRSPSPSSRTGKRLSEQPLIPNNNNNSSNKNNANGRIVFHNSDSDIAALPKGCLCESEFDCTTFGRTQLSKSIRVESDPELNNCSSGTRTTKSFFSRFRSK